MRRFAFAGSALALLAACQPPASDDYVSGVEPETEQRVASDPLPSPDSEGAIWAQSAEPNRIVYGQPGEVPFAALACETGEEQPLIRITRFVPADEGAQALMALVGNGHQERVPVEAVFNGRAHIWQGVIPANLEKLDVLTGQRDVELTVPGAGTLVLNPSAMPSELVSDCRAAGRPPDAEVTPEAAPELTPVAPPSEE